MVQSGLDRAAGDLPRPLNAASSCPRQSSLLGGRPRRHAAITEPNELVWLRPAAATTPSEARRAS